MSSADKQDERFRQIEEGRMAGMAETYIKVFIERRVDATLTTMIAQYRGGGVSFGDLLGRVAEISALRALMLDLQSASRVGEAAARVEFGDGQKVE